jgi:glycosyltransferase involved in cell wall biosynthesis
MEKRTMKILLLGAYPVYSYLDELGGGSRVVPRITSWNENLAKALSKLEYTEIHFITGTKIISETTTVDRENLQVTFLVSPPRTNMFSGFEYTRYHVQKIINRFQPDIVHGIGTEHIWPYIALRSRYPYVVTVHGIMSEINRKIPPPVVSRKRFFGFLERQVLKRTKHLITINPYVKEAVGKYTSATMYSVENPISELFFRSKAEPDSSDKILYVGSIEPNKDQITLIHAYSKVLKQLDPSNNAELIFVGPVHDVAYDRLLRQEILEAGLEKRVRFEGFLLPDQLCRLYASAGFLVLSSIQETAPMCIAEAMSCGLPVVSTRAGGVEYMVEEGVTGYTVPPRDPGALARAMLRLMEAPGRRSEMGCRAKQVAKQRFHPDLIARKTHEVYKKILQL